MGTVSDIVLRLREKGITVHEWAGWQTRGTGIAPAFVGGLIHHTATAYGMAPAVLVNGRGAPNPLAGPLANFAGNHDGTITVIAAGTANHAGASGGRSMGPLPRTTSFNKHVVGLEIVYPGTSPMTDAQYRAACIWARVVADVCGRGDIESVRAHAETSITGKWDPGYAQGKTIDMAAFRGDATNIGDDLTPDQDRMLRELHNLLFGAVPSFVDSNARLPFMDYLRWTDKSVTDLHKRLDNSERELAEIKDRVTDSQNYAQLAAPRIVDIQNKVTAGVPANLSPDEIQALVNAVRDAVTASGAPDDVAKAVVTELAARLGA